MSKRSPLIIEARIGRQRQPSAMDHFVLICQALTLAVVGLLIGIPLLILSGGVLISLFGPLIG